MGTYKLQYTYNTASSPKAVTCKIDGGTAADKTITVNYKSVTGEVFIREKVVCGET